MNQVGGVQGQMPQINQPKKADNVAQNNTGPSFGSLIFQGIKKNLEGIMLVSDSDKMSQAGLSKKSEMEQEKIHTQEEHVDELMDKITKLLDKHGKKEKRG